MSLDPSTWSPSARTAVWQALLLFGVVLAVRGSFALEPPGRDQGLFWTQAELLLGGARLYDQVWEHKPPGILALYTAGRALSPSYLSVHLLNALAVLATALMLCVFGQRRGLSQAGALFASLAYVLFASGPAFGGYWMIAQPEVFLDPLSMAALLLLGSASLGSALLAGVAIGVAVAAIKYSALPLVLLVVCVRPRDAGGARAHFGKLVFLCGCALPALALFAYFAATGRGQAWFDATVTFNLEHARIARTAFWSDPVTFAFPLLMSLLPFYVFGLGAVIDRALRGKQRVEGPGPRSIKGPRPRSIKTDPLLALGALLWLLALLQVATQGKFWSYHYHVMLIAFSIVAGIGVDRIRVRWTKRLGEQRAAIACLALALVSCSGYFTQLAFYARQHELVAAMSGELSDEKFSLSYTWGHDDYNFGLDRIVATHVQQTTRPDDRIFIWGFEPVIYSLAQRKPATRFLYDYPLLPQFSLHARYERELLADLHAHPPAQILVLRDDANDLETTDSATALAENPDLSSYLERGYQRSWQAGKFACYVRNP